MARLSPTTPVAVVGAGTMGAGIAQVAAAAGHPVMLHDARTGTAEAAKEAIAAALARDVAKGRMTDEARSALLDRIVPTSDLSGLAPAGLAIEAVVEDLKVKREVFAALEAVVADDAVLATNTSSLSVTAIAAGLRRPGRLVGLHFFNPAPRMALVEVVSGLATDADIAEAACATAAAWGKTPVHARSTPGFIVNRVARPFYGEAFRLLAEGAADAATIDAVMTESGGFPMGPFALMDLIGHDVNAAVTRAVFEAFGNDPRYAPSPFQAELIGAGWLGRKAGRGVYDYGGGAPRPMPQTAPAAPPPTRVVVEGDLGPAESLADAIVESGLPCGRTDGRGRILLDGAVLRLGDGRMATERAAAGERDLVLFDLALDYRSAGRVALAVADQAGAPAAAAAAGLFQALGKAVSIVDDVPGLIVLRTVAMLANEAADAVRAGVAEAAAVDTAMTIGVNYPLGPLAWAGRIGIGRVVTVLDNLARVTGEDRYRASPGLRRRVWAEGEDG